ncbi:winged helix-turn-helix domain-containing protein [Paraglaciecola sp.]|uniref:winged helix-turn-helix domain-containing protein n=1 Tax=Paraglaciecola sp. TaxID=1920173 RepID=UPI003EF203A8
MDNKPYIFQFCGFVLDPNTQAFSYKGTPVDLPEKSFQLLEKLLSADKQVVEKYTLLDELWRGLVVSEWSLSRLVSDTRQILTEHYDQGEIIQTLRGKGFRIHPNVQVNKVAADNNASSAVTPALIKVEKTFLHPKYYYLGGLCLLVVLLLYWFTSKDVLPPEKPFEVQRLTVLPVQLSTGDDQDRWVEYGVMTMVIEELQRFPQIQVADMHSTLTHLPNIQYDYNDSKLFQQVCPALGCKQLLLMRLTLTENREPSLSYQLLSADKSSTEYHFINQDILEASNMMLEHLLQLLLPNNPDRLFLSHAYSDNAEANQDFAIGVSRLYHGEYQSAEDYLKLALKREPTFTWAKIFLVEILYREGKLADAKTQASNLLNIALEIRQSIFLQNLLSNIAYSEGNLARSIEMAKAFLPAVEQIQDQNIFGATHMNIGTSFQALGDIEQGLEHLNIALATFQEHHFKLREAQALLNLGNTIWVGKSDADLANHYYQQAADLFRHLGAKNYVVYAKHMAAGVKVSSGRFVNAKRELNEVVSLYRSLQDKEGVLIAQSDLTLATLEEGNYLEAEKIGVAVYNESGEQYTYPRSIISAYLALIYLNLGQFEQAKIYIEEREKYDWFDPRPGFSLLPASYAHATGNFELAVKLCDKVKQRLNGQWQAGHQKYADAFAQDLMSGQTSITDYANFHHH